MSRLAWPLLPLASLLLRGGGCMSYSLVESPILAADLYPLSAARDGVTVAIDPFARARGASCAAQSPRLPKRSSTRGRSVDADAVDIRRRASRRLAARRAVLTRASRVYPMAGARPARLGGCDTGILGAGVAPA